MNDFNKIKNSIHYKNNRLQQIRGFCNTVIFEGVTKAAEQMSLTQSAVSMQITSLERDLKMKLFKKDGRKLKLTEDGRRFYEYVIPALKQMDNIYEEFLIENDEIQQNELRIAGYHSAITNFLPQYAGELLDNNPEISLKIENISRENALDKLRIRETDLAFYPMGATPDDLISLKIIKIAPTLVVSKNSKLANKTILTPEDIANENMLLVDNFQMLKIYNALFEKYKIKSRINFVNANWEMIRFFTKKNIGNSFYGDIDSKAQDEMDGVVSINISNLFPVINYHLLSATTNIKKSVRIFLDILNRCNIGVDRCNIGVDC